MTHAPRALLWLYPLAASIALAWVLILAPAIREIREYHAARRERRRRERLADVRRED